MAFFDEGMRGHLVRLDDSSWVERDVLRIAEAIQDYDENLKLQFLGDRAAAGDAPYRLVELCPDGHWRVVFDIWELDDRVLERLFNADTRRVDILLSLDRNNNRVRRDNDRRYRESMAEAKDIVKHMLKSSKGKYSFPNNDGDIVTVDDDPAHQTYKVEPK